MSSKHIYFFLIDTHFCHPVLGSCRKTSYTNIPFRYLMSANMNQNTKRISVNSSIIIGSEICFSMCICTYVKSFFIFQQSDYLLTNYATSLSDDLVFVQSFPALLIRAVVQMCD